MMVIIFVILFILLWFLLQTHQCPHWRTWRMMKQFPGPPGVFLFGNGFQLIALKPEDVLYQFQKWKNEYGPIFKMWRLGIPSVILFEPEDIEVVLNSYKHIKKGVAYEKLKPWLNEGLLLSSGEKWKSRRKLLTPTFHFKLLNDCIHNFNKHSLKLLDELLETKENAIEIETYISKYTLQVICENAMGVDIQNLSDNGKHYIDSIKRMNRLIAERINSPLFLKDWIFNLSPLGREHNKILKILHSFTNKVIAQRRQMIKSEIPSDNNEKQKKTLKTFLDCLLDMNENQNIKFSEDDIREEVDTFMFEGHDTTSSALCAALFTIGHHHNVQERIFEELDSIFEGSEREVTVSDLSNVKYLECVIKETLRLFPSVPVIIRCLEEDLSIRNGKYIIPAYSSIGIFTYLIHRNSNIFPEPEKFKPERFLYGIKYPPFSYIPFSGGARNCIGQRFAMTELKITLITILRKARIQSMNNFENIKTSGGLILRPTIPFMVKVVPRKRMQNLEY